MRIFVTGGAGYIGSHVIKLLRLHGHEVVVYDNLSMGHRASLPAEVPLIEGDLRDFTTLRKSLAESGARSVMHFAGLALVGESMQQPEAYFDVNMVGGQNLLRSMKECGVNRIIVSSTCAGYGVPNELPIRESLRGQPVNAYGASKLMFEQMLGWYQMLHSFQPVVFRYFNAAGAWDELGEDHTPETHLIPNVLLTALGQRSAVDIYGTDYPTPDGTCLRDFIHVRDVARAHVAAVENDAVTGTFNLGTGRPVSVRQIVTLCREITGREIPVNELPRREGDPPALYADPALAREKLGWEPHFSEPRQVLEDAWRWHLAHPQGY
jgi:UDP-glucose 4-epimerase